MNGIISNENTFNISVPQGSILGPVLFLIHINHLPAFSTLLDCQMFADDTVVSYSGSDISEVTATVTSELDKLSNWMCTNKLTLNPLPNLTLNYKVAYFNFHILGHSYFLPKKPSVEGFVEACGRFIYKYYTSHMIILLYFLSQ